VIKVVSLVKRNPQVTHEEFARYWREVHAPLVRGRLPGMRKYVLNPAIYPPGTPVSEWDGIVEMHFDDWEARERAFSSPEWLADDRQQSSEAFLDLSATMTIVTEEYDIPLS
jgi:uncharacterized protein (TIGR02118 family)